jgi:transcriptional regulator with XRE-family HTH domain
MGRTRAAATRPSSLPAAGRHPGARLRDARLRRGLTQKQLAGDRYTASYVSALEKGLTRASMAALDYLARRLDLPLDYFFRDEQPAWERMRADLLLASEDWQAAADAYTSLLDRPLSEHERALVLRGRAEAACRLNQPQDAVRDAARAYETLVASGSRTDAAYAAYWLAYANYQMDNLAEARDLIGQVLAEVRAGLSVQSDFKLRMLVALANIEGVEGRHRQALALLEEGRALADDLDAQRRATFLFSLALTYSESGDHEAALRTGQQALALYVQTAAEREVASLHNTMALAHAELGHVAQAHRFASQALHETDELRDDRLRAHVLDTQARVALAADRPAESIGTATQAFELARSIGYARVEADALLTRARAHLAAGSPADAEADFASATEVLRPNGPRSQLRAALREWAAILVGQQRHPEAVTLLTEAAADDPPLSRVRS